MNKFLALLLTLVGTLMGTLVVAQSASAASCGQQVGSYQYAWPSPGYEQLTATTSPCRTDAPWVIVIHGGSWFSGTRANGTRETYFFYKYGWQVFNMDYRRGWHVSWGQQKDDIVAAYRWVVSHARQFHLNVHKGTAYGFSAGGQMAAWLGNLVPVSSVVSQSGVLQPQRLADDAMGVRPKTEPATDVMKAENKRETYMMGCSWHDRAPTCRAQWNAFDPETAITSHSAPVYMVQGTEDVVNPRPMIDAYGYWLAKHGVGHVAMMVNGFGHDNGILFNATPASDYRFYLVRKWIVAQW